MLFVVVPVISQAGGADSPVASAANLPKIHIDNFGRVSANYCRGAEPDDAEYGKLASSGVKTIIDLRSDEQSSRPQPPGNQPRVLPLISGQSPG
jgi:hypothetical protein